MKDEIIKELIDAIPQEVRGLYLMLDDREIIAKIFYEIICQKVSEAVKGTAKKFVENAKMKLKDKLHKGKALHAHVLGKEYVQRIFQEVVDEIRKEITDGEE